MVKIRCVHLRRDVDYRVVARHSLFVFCKKRIAFAADEQTDSYGSGFSAVKRHNFNCDYICFSKEDIPSPG